MRHTILFSKLGSSSELPIFEIVTDFFERLLAAVSQSGYLIVPEVRQTLSAMIGYYFGQSSVR